MGQKQGCRLPRHRLSDPGEGQGQRALQLRPEALSAVPRQRHSARGAEPAHSRRKGRLDEPCAAEGAAGALWAQQRRRGREREEHAQGAAGSLVRPTNF